MTQLSDASTSNGSRPADESPGFDGGEQTPVPNSQLSVEGPGTVINLTAREATVRADEPAKPADSVQRTTANGAASLEVVRPSQKSTTAKKAADPKKKAAPTTTPPTTKKVATRKVATKKVATKPTTRKAATSRAVARSKARRPESGEALGGTPSSASGGFDQIRWQRAYDRTAVEAFRASVDAERARLTSEIESARERVATLRQAFAGRSQVRSEVTALVASAQRELAELDKDYQELLTTIRARGEAEAARILTEARTEAAAIQNAVASLSGLQSSPNEASLPAWLSDPRVETLLRRVQPHGA